MGQSKKLILYPMELLEKEKKKKDYPVSGEKAIDSGKPRLMRPAAHIPCKGTESGRAE